MPFFRVFSYARRMKHFLVVTDFSSEAYHSLRLILQSEKNTRVPVRILLVNTYLVDLKDEPHLLLQKNDLLKAQSKQNLEKQKSDELIWVRNPLITIETASHMGSLANVILNLIAKEDFDAVVIGKSESFAVKEIEKLLKKQKCSLIITDETAEVSRP